MFSHRGYDDDRGGRSFGGGQYRDDVRTGYSADRELDRDREVDEYRHRVQVANRRMEETSGQSLRTLNECLHMGADTAEELEVQAESLDRTEKRLDEMHVNLDQSKRHMRHIKSPFGGIANYFARKKKLDDTTDPKMQKGSTRGSSQSSSASGGPVAPPSMNGLKSTGNQVVDRNCDEMSKALHQLRGVGELIGQQLDDSSDQIERVNYKMERTDVKIKGVNRDIRRQL